MRLAITATNMRGGKKIMTDDGTIKVEVSYKNRILGTLGVYAILDDKLEGFRVIWREQGKGFDPYEKPLMEEERAKAKSEPREGLCHCGYPCIYGTYYCERHQLP